MLIVMTYKSNTNLVGTFQIEIGKHRVPVTILLRDIICMHNSLQLIQLQSPFDRKIYIRNYMEKVVPSPRLVDKITTQSCRLFHINDSIKDKHRL